MNYFLHEKGSEFVFLESSEVIVPLTVASTPDEVRHRLLEYGGSFQVRSLSL